MKPARRTSYPAGFFTALIRLHDWPPGFISKIEIPARSDSERRASASRSRDTQLAKGITGSIHGVSKKADAQIRRDFNVKAKR